MIAYRLTRRKFAHDLAGTGGLYAAGRCNHQGTAVIYAAQHISLALAEGLVHLDLSEMPLDYVLVTIEIPDTVPTRRATPEEALAASTDPDVPIFLVPSVAVPQELNVDVSPCAWVRRNRHQCGAISDRRTSTRFENTSISWVRSA